MPLHTTRGWVQASTSCTNPRLSISNGCPYPARPYLHAYATTAGSHPQSPEILRDPRLYRQEEQIFDQQTLLFGK